jgi:hypothetical protein
MQEVEHEESANRERRGARRHKELKKCHCEDGEADRVFPLHDRYLLQ